ncbi:helix-turn-helix domain-containing protein [Congregibacter variabilis]|uniref:Helix-turn-helix domain-containing protein n=1 Tax=Congregibacter variabilis TaxID=3081200 RepID=A0ABZ0HYM5_9GAMM|nr:helix-turn-helix domain-containing protein [Congregibacter sp. IMCC43200]
MPTANAQPRNAQKSADASVLYTRASSINRALDQIGDKWSLLIIQEVFWGINHFSEMLEATGVSRGVLSDRLKWLQSIGCLRKREPQPGRRFSSYHLTKKSLQLHASAMMAIEWERKYYRTPQLDAIQLIHTACSEAFTPTMRCSSCAQRVNGREVSYSAGPGATRDQRQKKVRRRSSLSSSSVPSQHSVYRNLIDLVGDRWTANIIALAFHGNSRFDTFLKELPVATNILSDRLKLLEKEGIFVAQAYQERPRRFEYHLTEKGWDLFPYFLTLLQWGDRWCDPKGLGPPIHLTHQACAKALSGEAVCSRCNERLAPFAVSIKLA